MIATQAKFSLKFKICELVTMAQAQKNFANSNNNNNYNRNYNNNNNNWNNNNRWGNNNNNGNNTNFTPSQIEVSKRQKGNSLLRHMTNCKWGFNNDIIPDYVMSPKICALYLSVRYHKMNRSYIHGRISKLRSKYMCRILLLHIDDGDNYNDDILIELNKVCCINKLILICAWSYLECARYIETYHYYKNKSVDCLMSSSYKQYINKKKNRENNNTEKENKRDDVIDILSQVKSVTSTNVATVMNNFGTIGALSNCTKDELTALPGFGNKKAKYLFNAFNKPFKTAK